MKNRNLISISDYTKDEYLKILEIAEEFEKKPVQNILEGKVIASCSLSHQLVQGLALRVLLINLAVKSLVLPMPDQQV